MEFAEKVDNFQLLTNRKNKNRELQKVTDALPFHNVLADEDQNIIYAKETESAYLNSETGCFSDECNLKNIGGYQIMQSGCKMEESVAKVISAQNEVDTERGRWLSSCVCPTSFKTQNGKRIYFHMLQDISAEKKSEDAIRQTFKKLTKMTEVSISAISRIVESRDPYTALHQSKVGSFAFKISKELGYSDKMAESIKIAGILHDIGKMAVPIEILYKPGKLSKSEFEEIKRHSQTGYEILKDIDFDLPVEQIALQHHERLDGSGYPFGLKERQILEETKIISVADVLDAMTSHRPYRPKRSIEAAIEELESNSGVLYDRRVVKYAVKLCRMGELQQDSQVSGN